MPATHALFLLSGAAGLVYQVAWVRAFSAVFGGSVHAASVVTATFLAGLGLGGWLAGAWADRHRGDLLRAWGLTELVIGAFGLAVAAILPSLLPLSAAISRYGLTPEGWSTLTAASHLGRVAVAVVVLAPPAVAMGATLSLLVRDQVVRAEESGWRVGGLYAANTLGAAAGALATDTIVVPALGLLGAQLLAVGTNLGVGSAALLLARGAGGRRAEAPPDRPQDSRPTVLIGALFLAGVAAMGLELAWFRFLAGALGPYRAVFSLLLGVILAGQAVGAVLAGRLALRLGRPDALFVAAQGALVLATVAGLLTYDPYVLVERQHAIAAGFEAGGPLTRAWLVHGVHGAAILGLVGLPALAMGAAFPLANAVAQDDAARVGRRAGGLYLATTAGNVVGALVTGFFLLPGPGIQVGVIVLCGCATASAALLVRDRATLVPLVPALVGLGWIGAVPADTLVWSTFPYGRARDEGVLELREGLEQILVVTGRPEGPARLWTSGHPMTSTTPHAQRYMRAMAHVPLLLRDDPRRALVICVGAGNTLHAVTLHPSVTSVEAVDLSADVLAVSPWFAHSHHGVLDHPRVRAFVNDGRHHLLLQEPATYDLIALEPPPLAVAGVSSLYTRDFYALAATRLTDEGLLAQWLPAYQVPEAAVRSVVRAFVDVFPHAVLLVGSGRELVLVGGRSPLALDPEAFQRRLEARPEVAADLARIGLGSPRELALGFAADRDTLVAASAGAPPITDDRPILESAQASHLMTTRLPPDLFAPERLPVWCPRCDLAELGPALGVTAKLYRSEAFLRYRSAVPDLTSVLPPPDFEDATLEAIAGSTSLTRVLVAPDALALRAQELWSVGDRAAAHRHLAAARAQAPGVSLFDELAAAWSVEAATDAAVGEAR